MPCWAPRLWLMTFALLASVGAQGQPRPAPGGGYPDEKEIAVGKDLAARLEREVSLLTDTLVVDYVKRLGDRLVRASGASFPVTTKVTDSRQPDLSVLPGGFLHFSSGLIAGLETEAELAGVMAHAIAHIAARHGSRLVEGPRPAGKLVPLVFLPGRWGGLCTRLSGRTLLPVALQSKARAFEEEADWTAVEYLREARYDPHALISGFRRLQADGSSAAPLEEKPALQQRIEEALRAMPEHVVNASAFDQVKARLKPLDRSRRRNPPRLRGL